jgi:glucose/arabinose dehydrogenase
MRALYALLSASLIVSGCSGDGGSSEAPAPQTQTLTLRVVAEGLTAPVDLSAPADGSGRLFVADQAGQVRVISREGVLQPEPFLDLRGQLVPLSPNYDERGLLGLAFHPQFAANGRFFVHYSAPLQQGAPAGWDHTGILSEFRVSAADPNLADPASERVLLRIDQPQANHNGGTAAFGPDGFLYLALGDGGGANDTADGHVEDWFPGNAGGNGQDVRQNLLGSILRIDVDGAPPYGIPPDNPFLGTPDLDEIFAYGFRNPYRFSFDRAGTRQLVAADVGQELWEEVNVVTRGGNYGWNVKEGSHCFDAANPGVARATCPGTEPDGKPLVDPVLEFLNAKQPGGLGLAVVGGHVYRGAALPELAGRYVFGAWSASREPDGRLLVATPGETGSWPFAELSTAGAPAGRLGSFLLGFGLDEAGELYVLTSGNAGPTGATGKVLKLVP